MSNRRSLSYFFVVVPFTLLATIAPAQAQTLFEGARLITGDGGVIGGQYFSLGSQIVLEQTAPPSRFLTF